MTLGEELRRKYALTSFKASGNSMVILAINEALEIAAAIADQEKAPSVATNIRKLKWTERSLAPARHATLNVVPYSAAAETRH
ncbi:MAG: hypothetical protein JO356_13780 [Acidobacteria bacterium]|nr:hypothetical protein [Acidobacteriota bacterium]